MKVAAMLAASLFAASSTFAMAQGTTKDGATANEKPGQGTNTGVTKTEKMMGPNSMAPAEGSSSGASAGSSGDSKGMPPTQKNSTGTTKH